MRGGETEREEGGWKGGGRGEEGGRERGGKGAYLFV